MESENKRMFEFVSDDKEFLSKDKSFLVSEDSFLTSEQVDEIVLSLNNIVLNKTLSEDYKIFTDDVLFKLLSDISALEEIWESDYRLPLNEKNYKVYGNNIMTAFTTEGINNSILRIVTMGYPVKRISLSTEKDNK